jgi:hypothetical protein
MIARWETRSSHSWLVFASSLVLALIGAILVFGLLHRTILRYQINYNEGWNSILAQRVIDGKNLYSPNMDLINNYPPLSFYLVAAMSLLVGPVWVAGRLLSWVSFFGCAASIALIVQLITRCALGALFGGLVFVAIMASRYDGYVGMFDPQLTAHLFLLMALTFLVATDARSWRAAIVAAVLTVVAVFVKHSVIALPLAVTMWLGVFRRRLLVPWIATGALAGAAGLAMCYAAYGGDFIVGLTAPRAYTFSRAYPEMVFYTVPISPLLVIGFLPAMQSQSHDTSMLFRLYLALALAVALLGFAGDGTNYNLMFDVIIALSLGIGYGVGSTLSDPGAATPAAGWIALATTASVLLSTVQMATMESTHWSVGKAAQDARANKTARIVALFAAQPDPVLCEALLLCYWAGKPAEIDPFNFSQAILTGDRSASTLLARIRHGDFAYVQVDEPADGGCLLGIPGLRAALTQRYHEIIDIPGVYQRS